MENKNISLIERKGSFKLDKNTNLVFYVISIVAIILSLLHIYTGAFGAFLSYKQKLIDLSLSIFLVFLLFGAKRQYKDEDRRTWYDWMFSSSAMIILFYFYLNYETMVWRVGSPNNIDIILGIIYLILVLEGTRRTIGIPMVIIALVFIFYTLFGSFMPGFLAHRGISFNRFIDHMIMGNSGILGLPVKAAGAYIYIFVLFGILLEVSKAGEFFINLALRITGATSGGPAKTAVLASAFMGTISGSSIANVVMTGSFTIPLMIKSGYKKSFAAAVEAAASTGGQFMPPIMGAAAFIMVEYTHISYINIMVAASLPAIIYFFGVFTSVHLEAKRMDLGGLSRDQIPNFLNIVKRQGYLLIPLFVIIYSLIKGNTPMKAGFYAVVLTVILGLINNIEIRKKPYLLLYALKEGAIKMVPIFLACSTAGVIAGSISLSGIGLKIASFIEIISQGNIFIALILTMIACIILGMGLPTVATYIVLVTIVAPALTRMGIPLLAAHLFVFYFGIIADITPPVALASFAASGIANSNTFKTGLTGLGIAISGFIVPFLFVLIPKLLLPFGESLITSLFQALPYFITTIIGVYILGCAIIGFCVYRCNRIERIFLGVLALLIINKVILLNIIGIFLFIIFVILKKKRINK